MISYEARVPQKVKNRRNKKYHYYLKPEIPDRRSGVRYSLESEKVPSASRQKMFAFQLALVHIDQRADAKNVIKNQREKYDQDSHIELKYVL